MEEKQDLRVIKTRRIIKNSLIELMAEREISSITITALSERAMINRKTFYRHYSTVAEVVQELENEILAQFSDMLRSSNTSCLDVIAVVADMSALISQNREYFSKMLKLNPDLFSKGRIKAMLRRAVAVSLRSVGEVRDENTLNVISEFIVSGLLALYGEWFDNGCTGDLDKLTLTAQRFVTEGLRGFVHEDKLTLVV